MNSLLNNRVGKPKRRAGNSGRKGCLFLVIGSLLALMCTGLFVLAVSKVTGVIIEARHGEEAAYALMTIVKPCYGAAMLCFYGILAVWYISPSPSEAKKEADPTLAPMLGRRSEVKVETSLSRRSLWLITAGLSLGVLLTGAICVNTYRLVTPDGIRTYFFAETSRYEWKQVSAYTIDCDSDDGLSVTFTMRNGKKHEILQGVNSATQAFKDNYTSVTHFAADIDDKLVELQVPRNVRHLERAVKFYKNNYTGLWPYVSRLIGYNELVPEGDETAPETVGDTTVDTPAVSETVTGTVTEPLTRHRPPENICPIQKALAAQRQVLSVCLNPWPQW